MGPWSVGIEPDGSLKAGPRLVQIPLLSQCQTQGVVCLGRRRIKVRDLPEAGDGLAPPSLRRQRVAQSPGGSENHPAAVAPRGIRLNRLGTISSAQVRTTANTPHPPAVPPRDLPAEHAASGNPRLDNSERHARASATLPWRFPTALTHPLGEYRHSGPPRGSLRSSSAQGFKRCRFVSPDFGVTAGDWQFRDALIPPSNPRVSSPSRPSTDGPERRVQPSDRFGQSTPMTRSQST